MRIPHRPDKGMPSGSTDRTNGVNLSDKIAIIAQKYAGYFTGSEYRFDQQSRYLVTKEDKGIHIGKKWKEPVVLSDDCDFCTRLTDEDAVRRVAGFQHQIDIEILRSKGQYYNQWLRECGEDVVETQEVRDKVRLHPEDTVPPFEMIEVSRITGRYDSETNRRRFCELFQDVPRVTTRGAERPDGWQHKPTPMVALPLRLKRKLCIEWNHVYRDYLADNPEVYYDFEKKQFFKEVDPPPPCPECKGTSGYDGYGQVVTLHTPHCGTPIVAPASISDFQEWLEEVGGVWG